MANDTAPSPELLLNLLRQAEDFIAGFEGAESQEGIDSLLRSIRAVTGDEPPNTGFAVVQEGGSSVEIYLHVSKTREDAEAFQASCTEGAYRTSGVIEVPASVAAIGEDAYGFAADLLKASLDLEYA